VEYLHLQQIAVADNDLVTHDSVLGYTMPTYTGSPTCKDESDWPHVHFAFLTGSGHSGHYVSMAGRNLCGYTVDAGGTIVGLGSPNPTFRTPEHALFAIFSDPDKPRLFLA